ncbi:hypothetical protein GCM10009799_37380 [Nocardiopsis rhodophaea]|uniref:Uncharacterized protein n=1 Tax=Nocardiopsis rhodophaea TaxID=280238 RepID=A0ABN2TFW8_9ACTN
MAATTSAAETATRAATFRSRAAEGPWALVETGSRGAVRHGAIVSEVSRRAAFAEEGLSMGVRLPYRGGTNQTNEHAALGT